MQDSAAESLRNGKACTEYTGPAPPDAAELLKIMDAAGIETLPA